MKNKLLLCLAVFTFAAQISLAQEAPLSAREQFEAWKQEKIAASGENASPFFYIVVTAQRIKPEAAVLNFGIAGFKNNFEVTVTPVKMEQTLDGKWTRTKFAEAGKIQMSSGDSTKTAANFADPTMKIVVDGQANALQIEFKFDGESVTRFTTVKLSEKSSTGKFIRLENKSVL